MRHKLCRSFHPWCPGVKTHCLWEMWLVECVLNSLWPSDVIWRQGSRSTLAQVLACCLTAPSHYLNQCWLMINEVLCHSPDSDFTERYLSLKWVWNLLIIPPEQRSCWGVYWFQSVRLSVPPSVRASFCPACRVRSGTSTVLDGFFPY